MERRRDFALDWRKDPAAIRNGGDLVEERHRVGMIWLSEKGILYLYVFSLLIFGVTTLSLLKFGWNYQTVGLCIIPGVVLTFVYRYAIRNFSDILFYFYLDGLMALSALLTTFLIRN